MANLSMTCEGRRTGTFASFLFGAALAHAGTMAAVPPATGSRDTSAIAPSAAFLSYWKSGLAEISSYAITAERYGELRKAQGVMVFVYEEINADTRIKVESDKTPPGKRVAVLKLNNVLKFTTGIYDYSVMTSVFAGLSGPGVHRPFQPQKVSFTSQEWCGSVFHQLLPGPKGLKSEIHSYFEAEGDSIAILPYPVLLPGPAATSAPGRATLPAARFADGSRTPFYYEDELPILVRELDGPFLREGESIRVNLVPSLWERRKRHVPLAFTEAILTKAGAENLTGKDGSRAACKWTLGLGGFAITYHVEAVAPRKLLAWENTRGEKGALIASIRNGYWEHNHNSDAALRKKLGLAFGVGPE